MGWIINNFIYYSIITSYKLDIIINECLHYYFILIKSEKGLHLNHQKNLFRPYLILNLLIYCVKWLKEI